MTPDELDNLIETLAVHTFKYLNAQHSLVLKYVSKSLFTEEEQARFASCFDSNTMELFGKICAELALSAVSSASVKKN